MHRLWLIFAQTATIVMAALFVVSTLKPELLERAPAPQFAPAAGQTPLAAATPRATDGSYADAAQTALPSVVHIYTSAAVRTPRHPLLNDPLLRRFFGIPDENAARVRSGLGSGVLVSKDGYILTNNHVIDGADAIQVALGSGSKQSARVVGRDPESDIAVLKIDTKEELTPIAFGADNALRIGDVVLAIGNPFGVGQTVTMGIVSALGRSELGINTFENFIQTDAAINPGNSGGALIDTHGRLVGINTAIYSRSGGSQGIGFAIPASAARSILEQIIKDGRVTRGWIGVQIEEALSETPDTPLHGAQISALTRNGPAAQAGLRVNDLIIAIDETPVTSLHGMIEQIAAMPPNRTARVTVMRDGKRLNAEIRIGERPSPQRANEE